MVDTHISLQWIIINEGIQTQKVTYRMLRKVETVKDTREGRSCWREVRGGRVQRGSMKTHFRMRKRPEF
jgi:hypothetical protein